MGDTHRIGRDVEELLGVPVRTAVSVPGGDLNEAYRVTLGDGTPAFAKTSRDAPPGAFAAEAAGLRWLADAAGDDLAVPAPLGASDRVLVLEWLEAGPRGPDFDERLGRGLAQVHAAGAERFGATPHDGPTYLGPLVLDNDAAGPAPSWGAFHAACRLEPVGRVAEDRGLLPAGTFAALDALCGELDDLAGQPEPVARIHGDLWGGNVMAGADGRPVIFDPAPSGGHRETDLAMLRLFGGPSPSFHAAYAELRPPAPGQESRVALHQVFPLLVHAALFGGGYGTSARRAIDTARGGGRSSG